MKMTRRNLIVAALAGAATAFGRTQGMLLHLSPGAIGLKGSPHEILDWAAQFGFDVIDATPACVAELSAEEMKAKKVGWAMAGLPVDFRQDDARFRDSMSKFPSYAQAMHQAGVQRVTTWLTPTSKDLTYIENFKQHTARLREIAQVLNDNQLRFGIEYVGPKTAWASQRFPFVHTMREMKELIAAINQPNVGIVLDSWHWYNSHETREDILTLKARDVVSVDLNDAPAGVPIDEQVDNKRELPASTGVIDAKAFLSALKEIGYEGPVRAEPFNEAVRKMQPQEALAATMASLKKAFAF
jgi:sugar phosphate isomerase/epimerase